MIELDKINNEYWYCEGCGQHDGLYRFETDNVIVRLCVDCFEKRITQEAFN